MRKGLITLALLFVAFCLRAQETYTMGYDKIDIQVVDPNFFSEYQLPGQPFQCGVYDKESATFYTCDYQTFRNVDEEFIQKTGKDCCTQIDFDPAKYYGTLTLTGTIDSIEWDSLIVHFITDKARLTIKTDEREIDALYDRYYKKERLGKLTIKLRLVTFDKPVADQISYNNITERKVKPKRHLVRILRW